MVKFSPLIRLIINKYFYLTEWLLGLGVCDRGSKYDIGIRALKIQGLIWRQNVVKLTTFLSLRPFSEKRH